MRNFYYFILFVGIALFVFNAARLNFDDLSWKENSNAYLGIIGPFFIILAMAFAIRSINKKKKNEEKPHNNLYGNE